MAVRFVEDTSPDWGTKKKHLNKNLILKKQGLEMDFLLPVAAELRFGKHLSGKELQSVSGNYPLPSKPWRRNCASLRKHY